MPDHPEQYGRHAWPGFAVMLGVNLLGLVVIILRRDITWAIAATWICVSEWSVRPKPPPVFVRESKCSLSSGVLICSKQIVVVLFTVLHPLILVSTIAYDIFFKQRRRGAIALPADDDYHQPVSQGRRGPTEVDTESWG